MTPSNDIIIDTAFANRTAKELENVIGYFVNILLIKLGNLSPLSLETTIEKLNQQLQLAQEVQDRPIRHHE